jgi:tetratricopeptide (TPR) repeat protein
MVVVSAVMASNSVLGQGSIDPAQGPDGDSLFAAGRMAVHDGRFELADDLLREVVDRTSDRPLAWAYLAVVDVFLWRNPDSTLTRAQPSDDDEEAGTAMAAMVSTFAAGDFEECADELIAYLEDNGSDLFARDLLGMTYQELGMTLEAVETFRDLLRDHIEFVPAWFHLGSVFLETGDLPKARTAFKRFLEESPDNPVALDAMAEILARSGDPERAMNYLFRALDIEPRMAEVWVHMGDILAEAGQRDGAAAAYQKAIEGSRLYGDPFRESVEQRLSEL